MSLGDEPSTHPRDEDERETYADVQARAEQFRAMGFFKREAIVETTKPVEWTETESREIVCRLVVMRFLKGSSVTHTVDATPDDLRAACAAVGMVVDGDEFQCALHLMHAREALTTEKARAEEYDSRLTAMRVALTEAGVPEDEAYSVDEALSANERSLRAGGRVLGGVERIERLAARAEKAEKFSADMVRILRVDSPANALITAAAIDSDRHDLRTKLAAAEAELKDVKGHHDGWMMQCGTNERTIERLTAEREEARAKLAALTAPVEGEPTEGALYALWENQLGKGEGAGYGRFALTQWRAGYAACAARHQPTEPRATEEELVRVFYGHFGPPANPDIAGITALTTRVRAERPACLVERAVKAGESLEVWSTVDMDTWSVRLDDAERLNIPRADVRATLDAMLTEVGA